MRNLIEYSTKRLRSSLEFGELERMNGSVAIVGARVVTPGQDLGVVNVRVEDGRIVGVGPDVRPAASDLAIAADGLTLLP